MSASPTTTDHHPLAIGLNRSLYWLSRHWLLPSSLLIGLYVAIPWLAPFFMHVGWTNAGRTIYLIYTVLCHQLPQRSFFLFGNQIMYSLGDVQLAWQDTNDPLILRQFTGDPAMGWKVAWSDRMVFMYTTILFWALLYWLFRKRIRPLPLWGLILFLLPMAIDGISHTISDFSTGIGLGFRDTNSWLALLTNNSFPATFYAGDALGSFNSWMRLITGLLFSLGFVWAFYPRLHNSFSKTTSHIEEKFRKSGLKI